MVGATGFEPATPCAQGKLGRPRKVLIPERFAALSRKCDQIWDHPSGDAWRSEANDGAPTTAIRSSSIRQLEAHAL